MTTVSLDGTWELKYGPEKPDGPWSPDELLTAEWPTIEAIVPGNVELRDAVQRHARQPLLRIEAEVERVDIDVVHIEQPPRVRALQHRGDEIGLIHFGGPEFRVVGDVLKQQRNGKPGLQVSHPRDRVPYSFPREGKRQQLVQAAPVHGREAEVLRMPWRSGAEEELAKIAKIILVPGIKPAHG